MHRTRSTGVGAILLAILAIAAAPAPAKDDAKPATGPLQVTYYYLPG